MNDTVKSFNAFSVVGEHTFTVICFKGYQSPFGLIATSFIHIREYKTVIYVQQVTVK